MISINSHTTGIRTYHVLCILLPVTLLEYLANKSKVTPAQLTIDDSKKRRSGTNMFKAQRNRLVDSDDVEDTNTRKVSGGAWLEIEREKTLIEEEKLRLEREKRQFEEERQQFEREKRRLQMEMARLKQ